MALEDHLEKVLVFDNIIQAGSLRKASKVLRVSQPSLSRTLGILERELQTTLVERSREGLVLTSEGSKFLKFAQRLRVLTQDLQSDIQTASEQHMGAVTIGTYESIAVYLFPFFLRDLQKKQKKLKLKMKTALSTALLDELRGQRVDLVVSVNPKKQRNIISEVLFRDDYAFYRVPTAGANTNVLITVLDATDVRGTSLRDFFDRLGLSKKEVIDCASFEACKALAVSGVGVAVLPTRVGTPLVEAGQLKKVSFKGVPVAFGEHEISVSCLKSRADDRVIMWLIEQMKRWVESELS